MPGITGHSPGVDHSDSPPQATRLREVAGLCGSLRGAGHGQGPGGSEGVSSATRARGWSLSSPRRFELGSRAEKEGRVRGQGPFRVPWAVPCEESPASGHQGTSDAEPASDVLELALKPCYR